MKKIWIFLIALFAFSNIYAQAGDASQLALAIFVEDNATQLSPNTKISLENKMKRLLTQNGLSSSDYFGQFFVSCEAVPISKDVVAGPPVRVATNVELYFTVSDFYNEKVFASTLVKSKGVGENDNLSLSDAIRNVKVNTPEMQKFIAEGREKILAYYESNAEKLILKAQSAAKQRNYQEALWIISTIPSECSYYERAVSTGVEIYQQYIDYQCDLNLAKAKSAWMSGQNSRAAKEAGEYLSLITSDAKCYKEAESLYKEIKGKILDDWNFEMKRYQDGVDLRREQIRAMRAVGVAYGTHQQPKVTHINFLRH